MKKYLRDTTAHAGFQYFNAATVTSVDDDASSKNISESQLSSATNAAKKSMSNLANPNSQLNNKMNTKDSKISSLWSQVGKLNQ